MWGPYNDFMLDVLFTEPTGSWPFTLGPLGNQEPLEILSPLEGLPPATPVVCAACGQ